MTSTEILIIGAGPAGLAIAGRLRHRGISFEIIEKSPFPGNSWRNHYERLQLHTVKEHSHLPHLPMPEDYPTFVPRQKVVDYLDQYVQHFDLQPHYNTEALEIKKSENGSWVVHCSNNQSFSAASVVIATGINNKPHRPVFPGEEQFNGTIIHSRAYRNPTPFLNKSVVVVGMGNTGAEIALDLSEHDVSTFISVRGPVNIVPRSFLGNPIQKTAFKLAILPNWLVDWIGKQIPKIVFGDLRPYGLETPDISPPKQLRDTGRTPMMDLGTVAQIKKGKIRVVQEIISFDDQHVFFKDGSKLAIDVVILATGYLPNLRSLIPRAEELFNRDHLPAAYAGTGFHEGLYFLGFDNYKPGGILGIIHSASKEIADSIESKMNATLPQES